MKALAESRQDCPLYATTVQKMTTSPWQTTPEVTRYRFPGMVPPMRSPEEPTIVRTRPTPVCSAATKASPAAAKTSRYDVSRDS